MGNEVSSAEQKPEERDKEGASWDGGLLANRWCGSRNGRESELTTAYVQNGRVQGRPGRGNNRDNAGRVKSRKGGANGVQQKEPSNREECGPASCGAWMLEPVLVQQDRHAPAQPDSADSATRGGMPATQADLGAQFPRAEQATPTREWMRENVTRAAVLMVMIVYWYLFSNSFARDVGRNTQ